VHILIIPSERYVPKENPLGGIFQYDQAHALQRAGLRIGVIAYEPRSLRFLKERITGWNTGFEFENDQGIPVYRYQGWSWVTGRMPYLTLWVRLAIGRALYNKYVAAHGIPDILHVHNAIYAGTLAASIKRHFRVPYVLTEHSSMYASGLIRRWQLMPAANAFRNANKRIVVSPHLGQVLEAQFGNQVSPWEWVPNVLDNRFERISVLNDRAVRTWKTFRFLNIAGLIEIKNHAVLLEAFASRFKGKDTVQLRIGGQGPLGHRLQALAEKLGIANQVVFLGLLSRDQVDSEMRACNAFVLSSDYETFGVVLPEALAHGKPVIATSSSGPDCIVHTGNGILVPPKNATALGDAMEALFQRIDNYDSRAIQADCIARFGENAVVQKLKSGYVQVLMQK
jgi:glycosyltransferase involved in cell wall biosynthesis